MRLLLLKQTALFMFFVFSNISQASGDIILDPGPGVPNLLSSQIMFGQEIGQSFTAENAQIATIGFFITDGNAAIAPDDFTVRFDLFEGVGSSGTFLGSRIFSGLSNGFENWADVDYSSVTFSVGQFYTALISNDTVRQFVQLNNYLYDGGDAIYQGSILNGEDSPATDANAGLKGANGEGVDLEFRVLDNIVPEPSTLLLLLSGLAGLGFFGRRKIAA